MTTFTLKEIIEQTDLIYLDMPGIEVPMQVCLEDDRNGTLELVFFNPTYQNSSGRRNRPCHDPRGRLSQRYYSGEGGEQDMVIVVDPNQLITIEDGSESYLIRSLETGAFHPVRFYDKVPKVKFDVVSKEEAGPTEVKGFSYHENKLFETLLRAFKGSGKVFYDEFNVEEIKEGSYSTFRTYIPESKDAGRKYDFPTVEEAIAFLVEKYRDR